MTDWARLDGGLRGDVFPCLASGNRPSPTSMMPDSVFADGIEGIPFTPGPPFSIRGGIQVFF